MPIQILVNGETQTTSEGQNVLGLLQELQIDPARLREYEALVKTGLPGMGYVRYDENAPWPESLQTKAANPQNLWTATGSKSPN